MKKVLLLLTFLLFVCLLPSAVFASEGTISSTYKYAWSNNLGWINFGNSYGNIRVSDTKITGYAWSDNYGWINMAPSNGGVTNTTGGVLGGYAWGENTSWINFTGVSIGCSGQFSGTATGDTIGTLTFGCTNCKVVTAWQKAGCSGGGGDPPPPPPPPPPTHNECNTQQQCVSVSGAGSNQCSGNSDCQVPTHRECSNLQCIVVNGTGNNQCQINDDCQVPTHNECNGQQQCVSVSGAGSNQCANNADCQVPTHNECNTQQQCVSVTGGGANQCSSNSDCQVPTHSECSNLQCIIVSGAGSNQCSTNSDCNSSGGGTSQHNECNDQKQCVLVGGAGSDQCQSNNDCDKQNILVLPIIPTPDTIVKIVENIIPSPIPKTITKVIQTPVGATASRIASTTGVIITTTAITTGILAYPASLLEMLLIAMRLVSFLLLAFGIKQRAKPWGVVYDSITKQPVDPAHVILKNIQTGKTYAAITDIDGRYGFLAEPGVYNITANKTNYFFPSQKLAAKTHDELYDNLYFGNQIEIKKQGEVITQNIPLDPIKFDWNEFAKKDKGLMKFYSRWDLALRKVSEAFFIIGFIVAIVAFFAAPYPYNTIVLGLYLFLLLLRVLGIKPKSLGYITDKTTNAPVSFAIMRIMLPDSHIEIGHKITDKYGRYYCLVPKGRYYIKIEAKNSDGSYSLAFTSPIIDASKNGIIKTSFKV